MGNNKKSLHRKLLVTVSAIVFAGMVGVFLPYTAFAGGGGNGPGGETTNDYKECGSESYTTEKWNHCGGAGWVIYKIPSDTNIKTVHIPNEYGSPAGDVDVGYCRKIGATHYYRLGYLWHKKPTSTTFDFSTNGSDPLTGMITVDQIVVSKSGFSSGYIPYRYLKKDDGSDYTISWSKAVQDFKKATQAADDAGDPMKTPWQKTGWFCWNPNDDWGDPAQAAFESVSKVKVFDDDKNTYSSGIDNKKTVYVTTDEETLKLKFWHLLYYRNLDLKENGKNYAKVSTSYKIREEGGANKGKIADDTYKVDGGIGTNNYKVDSKSPQLGVDTYSVQLGEVGTTTTVCHKITYTSKTFTVESKKKFKAKDDKGSSEICVAIYRKPAPPKPIKGSFWSTSSISIPAQGDIPGYGKLTSEPDGEVGYRISTDLAEVKVNFSHNIYYDDSLWDYGEYNKSFCRLHPSNRSYCNTGDDPDPYASEYTEQNDKASVISTNYTVTTTGGASPAPYAGGVFTTAKPADICQREKDEDRAYYNERVDYYNERIRNAYDSDDRKSWQEAKNYFTGTYVFHNCNPMSGDNSGKEASRSDNVTIKLNPGETKTVCQPITYRAKNFTIKATESEYKEHKHSTTIDGDTFKWDHGPFHQYYSYSGTGSKQGGSKACVTVSRSSDPTNEGPWSSGSASSTIMFAGENTSLGWNTRARSVGTRRLTEYNAIVYGLGASVAYDSNRTAGNLGGNYTNRAYDSCVRDGTCADKDSYLETTVGSGAGGPTDPCDIWGGTSYFEWCTPEDEDEKGYKEPYWLLVTCWYFKGSSGLEWCEKWEEDEWDDADLCKWWGDKEGFEWCADYAYESSGGTSGPTNTSDPCNWVSRLGGVSWCSNNVSYGSETISYGSSDKTNIHDESVTISVPDEVGSKVCNTAGYRYEYWYAIERGEDDIEWHQETRAPAAPYWVFYKSACRTVAKKPSLGFWNSSLLSSGGVKTSLSPRHTEGNYGGGMISYSGAFDRLYGSWSEYLAAINGNTTSFASGGSLASGSARNVDSGSGIGAKRSALTISNTNISNLGGSGITPSSTFHTRLNAYLGSLATAGPNTISTTTLAPGESKIITVSGDLNITGNISPSSNTYNSIYEIPQMLIFVNGNVNISGSVSNIDAWIIATGQINTCSDFVKNTTDSTGGATGVCDRQLIFNAPVFASKVILNRTYGSDTATAQGGRQAPAEVFNLSAESYLWAYAQAGRYKSSYTDAYIRELAPRY